MHKIDIKCFGIKYKKSKSLSRKMGKYKQSCKRIIRPRKGTQKKGIRPDRKYKS